MTCPQRINFYLTEIPHKYGLQTYFYFVRFKLLDLRYSKQFSALMFLWVIVTTLYHLMLQSWYQNTAQLKLKL